MIERDSDKNPTTLRMSHVNGPPEHAQRGEGLEIPGDAGRHGRVSEERNEPLPLPGQVGRQVPLRHDHLLPDVQAGQGKKWNRTFSRPGQFPRT